MILAAVIDYRDIIFVRAGVNHQERLFTALLMLVLSLFCGLRIWGNDTQTYREIFEYLTPTLGNITAKDIPEFSSGIGLFYISSFLKTIGFSSQDYLMVFAFATVIPYVWFVHRYSYSMVLGVFLMFTTGFYTFSLAAIKQCMATGLCLVAVSAALDRKPIRYFVFVGAAMLFHPYAVVYLLVPLMMFKPWTGKTWFYFLVFILSGFYLETLLGTVLDITDMMGANYSVKEFLGEGVNVFRVMVSFVPMLLAFLCGKTLFRNFTQTDNLMFNLAMVNGLIMFVGLFGTANYFARLANYFLPGQIITLPCIFKSVHPRDRKWLVPACIVGYIGFFIYENAIIRPFDHNYSFMTLWTYLASLF